MSHEALQYKTVISSMTMMASVVFFKNCTLIFLSSWYLGAKSSLDVLFHPDVEMTDKQRKSGLSWAREGTEASPQILGDWVCMLRPEVFEEFSGSQPLASLPVPAIVGCRSGLILASES